jgi:hypothetical protein
MGMIYYEIPYMITELKFLMIRRNPETKRLFTLGLCTFASVLYTLRKKNANNLI